MLEGINGTSLLQEYIYISRYSRFIHEEQRREVWPETVARYFDFFKVHLKTKHDFDISDELRAELEQAIVGMRVMPSMRSLMTAGVALDRDNIAGYNCAYVAIDNPKTFAEILYILMCGTGVGFSVEHQFVNKLPEVPDVLYPTDTTIIVHDSKLGWAKALNELISLLYTGLVPKWDVSRLRAAGSILKTFGGRSSGPQPLVDLFEAVVKTFESNRGSRLTAYNCHDIVCLVADCVVVGGVRRSALISLSDLYDSMMRHAKTGDWYVQGKKPHFRNSNNSAVFTNKQPAMQVFIEEWKSLYDSHSGERGIFSRYAAKNQINRSNEFRKEHFDGVDGIRYRDLDHDWGSNPCSEIILRNKQFCNLSEVIIRSTDTLSALKKKVRIAAILGTFQSTLTDFKFISKPWKNNTEDERLLGVSLTGINDNMLTAGQLGFDKLKDVLSELKKVVIATNLEFSRMIGIPSSVATTCVKPSGTVSSLTDTASGIHARHAPFYMRTVRCDKHDPVSQLMIDQGLFYEEDLSQDIDKRTNWVFYFPCKSPKTSVFLKDMNSLKQLELWEFYQQYWTEHKPSVTISVRDEEWMQVGAWMYDNFDTACGLSFFPFDDHVYQQAPYQEITEDQYKDWMVKHPQKEIDWKLLTNYEKEDKTVASQTLACTSGGCEI